MREFLDLYANRKMVAVLLLGFSSGLPLALTGGTMQAWLTDAKIDVSVIGAFSLIGLPYSLKLFWSPLMDRFVPPFLGRRRGWIFITQLLLCGAVIALSGIAPQEAPYVFGCLAVAIAFFSASQDIVIDAYRTELLTDAERGPGAGVGVLGYRVAMLTSGALALILADRFSWREVYLGMAAVFGVLSLLTFLLPDAGDDELAPRTLEAAVVKPLVDFFSRRSALEVLLFIVLYKLGDVMAVALTTKFMLDLGFTKSDIGYVAKGLGLACSIAGSILGGGAVTKWGLKKALFVFGVLQGVSVLCFAVLALAGHNFLVMSTAIGLENFCNGLGNAALVAFLMGLCNRRFTATQYSLLTSVQSVARTGIAATSGVLVAHLGWTPFFLFCTALAAPGLVLLMNRFDRWDAAPASE